MRDWTQVDFKSHIEQYKTIRACAEALNVPYNTFRQAMMRYGFQPAYLQSIPGPGRSGFEARCMRCGKLLRNHDRFCSGKCRALFYEDDIKVAKTRRGPILGILYRTLENWEVDQHRNQYCDMYDWCVDYAAEKRWRSFSCVKCGKFGERECDDRV